MPILLSHLRREASIRRDRKERVQARLVRAGQIQSVEEFGKAATPSGNTFSCWVVKIDATADAVADPPAGWTVR